MRRSGRVRLSDRLFLVAVALTFLVGWEIAARTGLVQAVLFPPPTVIAATMVRLLRHGALLTDLGDTLRRVLVGSLLGCFPACVLGLAMGFSSRLRGLLDPVVAALHPLPKIAVLPLLMVIIGVGEGSQVVAVALAAFFPMLIHAMAGVDHIEPRFFEVVESYGASRFKIFSRVVLPGSLPMLLAGLRIALNVALLLTIAVELIAARTGLGTMIWLAWETMRTEEVYAGLLVIGILGISINAAVLLLGAWLMPWHRGNSIG